MVYQQFINYPNLTVFENIASPLRVAGVAAGRDRPRACAETAELLQLDADARPPPARALRRPAAAHRARPRHRQGRRPRAARRAARQPRLQAPRGAARRAADALRRPRRDRRLRHHRARRRRCCSAATPRRCTRAASRSSARPPRSTASPDDLDDRPGLLRPADQRRAGRASSGGEIVLLDGVALARRPAPRAALPDGALHARPPAALRRAAPRRAQAQVPLQGMVLITEISGSESVVHFDARRRAPGSAQSHGVHPYRVGETARASTSTSAHGLYFAPPAALAREGRLMARIDARAPRATATCADPRGAAGLRAEGDRPRAGRTAAPMRCSAPRAAARPRCSTSSPA